MSLPNPAISETESQDSHLASTEDVYQNLIRRASQYDDSVKKILHRYPLAVISGAVVLGFVTYSVIKKMRLN